MTNWGLAHRVFTACLAAIAVLSMVMFTVDHRASAQEARSIAGVIWFDANLDGIRQADEAFAEGVGYTIEEFANQEVVRVVTDSVTNSQGEYGVDELAPGTYGLRIVLPDGFVPTDTRQGDDRAVDSDLDVPIGETALLGANLDLSRGATFPNLDLGLVPLGDPEISGIVWADSNGDGVRGESETGFGVVTYELIRLEPGLPNLVLFSGTTSSDGRYGINVVPSGNYIVAITFPPGHEVSPPDVGEDDTIDSDFIGVPNGTRAAVGVTVAIGETTSNVDVGLDRPDVNGIGGLVWIDEVSDGVQRAGELGVPDWEVVLFRDDAGTSVEVASYFTNEAGRYETGSLAPGRYAIGVAPSSNFEFARANVGDDEFNSDVDVNGVSPWVNYDGVTPIEIDAGLRQRIAADANCDGALNILDAFATAQYVVGLREGVAGCAATNGSSQISLEAITVNADDTVNIQTAFRVSQCVVGLENALCPAPQ